MNKIEKLITKFCPNGVEFKKLGEMAELIRGKGLSKKDIGTGQVPIILYGELYTTYGDKISSNDIVSFCDKSRITNQPQIQQNDILLPVSSTAKDANIGTISVYLDNKMVFLGGDAVIFRPDKSINSVFLMYCLNSNLMQKDKMQCVKGTTINHLDPQKFAKIKIPIPPLEIQKEIVFILDNFTKLTEKLTTELTTRKKQYEYYRDKLLTFGNNVQWKSLGEIAEINTGNKPKKIFEKIKEFEYINAGTTNSGYCDSYNCQSNVITTPSRGQGGIGFVGYQNQKFWLGALCYKIYCDNKITTKFLYYYLSANNYLILQLKKVGGIPAINKIDLKKLQIPIPSLSEQKRIVAILDKFDSLVNSLTEGIPREIELRQKQYEYYRDKLLSFKELL